MTLIISTWGQSANYVRLSHAIAEARLAFFRTLGKPDEQAWYPTGHKEPAQWSTGLVRTRRTIRRRCTVSRSCEGLPGSPGFQSGSVTFAWRKRPLHS